MNNRETSSGTAAGQGTILAVDDTRASLELLTAILTGAGYRVHPAESGELALAQGP